MKKSIFPFLFALSVLLLSSCLKCVVCEGDSYESEMCVAGFNTKDEIKEFVESQEEDPEVKCRRK